MNTKGKFLTRLSTAFFVFAGLGLISVSPIASHAQTQSEMNQQARKDSEVADAALNKAYKSIMGSLDKQGQTKLRASQRAWLVFRDRESEFVADSDRGGSIAPMTYYMHYTKMTKTRTRELKEG